MARKKDLVPHFERGSAFICENPFKFGESGDLFNYRPKGHFVETANNQIVPCLADGWQSAVKKTIDSSSFTVDVARIEFAVMRDPKAAARRRDEMAKAAAPYLHSKLAPIEPAGGNTINGDNKPLIYVDRPPDETVEQWEARQRRRLSEKPAVVMRTPVSSV